MRRILPFIIILLLSSRGIAQISFQQQSIDNNFHGANSIYVIDVDTDGDMDVLASALIDNSIVWYENDGFQNLQKQTLLTSLTAAFCVFGIDLDGDNDTDVLGAAHDINTLSWWENDGNENFTKHDITTSFGGAISVHAIDIDQDNDIDIVGVATLDGEIAWWEKCSGTFSNTGDAWIKEDDVCGDIAGGPVAYSSGVSSFTISCSIPGGFTSGLKEYYAMIHPDDNGNVGYYEGPITITAESLGELEFSDYISAPTSMNLGEEYTATFELQNIEAEEWNGQIIVSMGDQSDGSNYKMATSIHYRNVVMS